MAWLPIVVGIIIGYLIFQRKRQNDQTDSCEEAYSADGERESYNHYTSRSMADDQPQISGSADEYREINEAVEAGEHALVPPTSRRANVYTFALLANISTGYFIKYNSFSYSFASQVYSVSFA